MLKLHTLLIPWFSPCSPKSPTVKEKGRFITEIKSIKLNTQWLFICLSLSDQFYLKSKKKTMTTIPIYFLFWQFWQKHIIHTCMYVDHRNDYLVIKKTVTLRIVLRTKLLKVYRVEVQVEYIFFLFWVWVNAGSKTNFHEKKRCYLYEHPLLLAAWPRA